MFESITTTDLSDFDSLQLKQLELILAQWREHGLPKDFVSDEVIPMLNKNSGFLFLTNSEFQTAMLNRDNNNRLESHYHCVICGKEGFWDEFKDIEAHSDNDIDDCIAYCTDIELNRGEV
jgi:hypothetical protein